MTFAGKNSSRGVYVYIIVLFLVTLFIRILLTGYYNSNLGGIEQNVICGIQRTLAGQPLYQDPATGSYGVMQYTPLYYYFAAAVSKVFHIRAGDVQGIYTVCRVLALICNLLTVVVVAKVIRSYQFGRQLSVALSLPVLILLTTHYYTRGDSMHLFLFVSAFYSYLLFIKTGRLQPIALAALLSGACIMTKQSGVLIAGIIAYHLIFTERRFAIALFYCAGTILFSYLIAAACVQGPWGMFYKNACLGLKNGTDLSFLYRIFTSQYFFEIVPCYALGAVIVWLAVKRSTDRTFRAIATGVALSFFFALITGLKIGSSNNYFTEFLVFVLLAMPYLMQPGMGAIKLFGSSARVITIRNAAYAALLILITSKTMGLVTAVYIEKSIKNDKAEYAKEQQLYDYMTKTIGIKNGEHLFFSDRLFLDNVFSEYAIMPNKDVVAQVYAADHATYNYSSFVAGMNNGLIKYIITTEKKPGINEWNATIPFIWFDKNKFRLLATYLGYTIYVYSPL